MNGGVGSSEPVTWIALHWQRSRWRRRRRSGRCWRRCRSRDWWGAGRRRPTDRGRLPQRMSEGLVGAGNRCAAATAAEAVASPEPRQTDSGKRRRLVLFLPSVRPSSLSLFLPSGLAFLLSSQRADRPTAAGWRRNRTAATLRVVQSCNALWTHVSPATRAVNLLTMCDKGYMIDH